MGNHEELLALEGEYAKMWKIQSSENTDNRKIKEPDEVRFCKSKSHKDSYYRKKISYNILRWSKEGKN